MDRDLPADPPRGPVPSVRRPGREPRRAPGDGGQGRPERRDDGQLPHHPRQHARAGPLDVRGSRPERRPLSPTTARSRGRTTAPAGSRARPPTSSAPRWATPSPRLRSSPSGCGIPPRSCASTARAASRRAPTAPRTRDAQRPYDRPRGASGGAARGGAVAAPPGDRRRAGPTRHARRAARAAAVLEQLPRARRAPGRVRAAAAAAAERWGAGAGASRLVSGHDDPSTASSSGPWPRSRAARPRCCSAPDTSPTPGVIGALAGPGEVVFSDALNHASIIDGCRLARAETFVYDHCDLDHLRWGLRARGRAGPR